MGKKKKKKKVKFKLVMLFLLYEIIFTALTAPLYIYKGPFNVLKKIAVSTIMGTRHQYLVTTFLSKSEINSIIGTNGNNSAKVDLNNIKVTKKYTNNIKLYKLYPDSGRYDGYLIEIPDASKVRVAMTKDLKVQGEKTSDMAKEHNAIAAINGGAFNDNTSGTFGGAAAYPSGFVITKGNVVYDDSKNSSESVAAFTKAGRLIVGNYTLRELIKDNVTEAMCFRPPALIINGKPQITSANAASSGLQPRTAIGQKKDGTVLFLVMDGRQNLVKSGASLKDAQDELLNHGAVNATNLDGGFSSTIYYNGAVINNPRGWNGERYVATAFYVEP